MLRKTENNTVDRTKIEIQKTKLTGKRRNIMVKDPCKTVTTKQELSHR